jgi:hypothetical protein
VATVDDRVEEILESDHFEYSTDDTHLGIARRIKQEGLCDKYSVGYISKGVGRYRNNEVNDSSSSEQTESPDHDTWQDWAKAENDTGSSEGVDYRDKNHFYNEADDKYVIWPEHRDGSMVLDGERYRAIRKDYSNWTGSQSGINDILRTHELRRREFLAIKRSFNFVHNDSPFTDEQLIDDSVSTEERVQDLARQKEAEIEKEWQKKQWRDTQKDAKKWRHFKRGTIKPLYEKLQRTPIESSDYRYADGQLDDFFFFPHTTDTHLEQLNEDGTGLAENKKRFLDCLHKNVNRCGKFGRPRKTVIQLGGDQFNSDHPAGQTTNGTPQQQSVAGPEAFFKVADAGIEAIEICRKLSPVEVRVVPGNHDWRSAVAYYWGLQHKYSDVDGVDIVGGAEKWQFDTYGKNLVTWTHGDKVGGGETKQNWNLSSILLHECPQMVGESTHFYCFLGHLHHLLEKEDGVHTLQGGSTAKQDRWHKVGKHGSNHACQTAYILEADGGQKVRFTAEP